MKLLEFKLQNLGYLLILFFIFNSCSFEGSVEDKNEIERVWKTYYSSTISQEEKNKLLSREFKEDYISKINSAIRASEKSLRDMAFEDKLNILSKRYAIDSLKLSDVQLNTFEKAFDKIQITSTELIPTDQGLKEIIFSNKEKAFGIFNLFLSEKSNQFVKEDGSWKINPMKEHPKYTLARTMLKRKYIKEYGSEDAAIEEFLKLITGKTAIWTPLRK